MAADMKASGACRALVRQFEGCYLQAYRCPAGIPTIGVGHTRNVKMGDRCTVQQADIWLSQDLEDAEAAVASLVKVPLKQEQFDALTSFTFNLGCGALKRSTLLKTLNAGDVVGACQEFAKWSYASGRQVNGLLRRRTAEAALFAKP